MAVETADSPNGFRLIVWFFRSSVGAKVLMALTGLLMWGFLIGHLLGNLQVFLPAAEGGYLGQQMNDYAYFLKTTPSLLWGTRVALLLSIVLHAAFGIRLSRLNRAARGRSYDRWTPRASTVASRYMVLSGLIIFSFVVFHLAHFTLGYVDPAGFAVKDQAGHHDVYGMMWAAFRHPGIVVFYVVGMALLFMHLFHGSVSLFQSVGLRSTAWTPVIALVAKAIVFGLLVGFAAIPTVIFVSWQMYR